MSAYPDNLISGKRGCPKCGISRRGQYKKLTTEDFIQKSNQIHNNYYNYDKTIYELSSQKVIITCPMHGDFEQTPNHHLSGEGCPICKQSSGEKLVESILIKYNIPFKREVTFRTNEIIRNRKEFRIDFVVNLNDHLYFIEYSGIQHYIPVEHFGGEIEFKYVRNFVYQNKQNISLLELSYKLKKINN